MSDKGLASFLKAKQLKLDDEDAVVKIEEATERNGKYSDPFPSGIDLLDKAMLGGFREGDLVTLTGLSGCGKTLALQNLTVNISDLGHGCLWFSYEVIVDNIYAKFQKINKLNDNLKIYVPKKTTSGNLNWVFKKIKEGIEKFKVKFVFIDHLDFIYPKEVNKNDQRRIMIDRLCTELKDFAKENKVIIFMVSHVKKVQGREIEMQDLAESGAAYKLADMVLAVARNSVNQEVGGKKVEVSNNEGYLKILKNRVTGQLGFINYIVSEDKMIFTGGFIAGLTDVMQNEEPSIEIKINNI